MRLFAHDESRWSLHTIRRRRITARGVKPQEVTQHERGSCWLYGSIEPDCGEPFWLLLPELSAVCMQCFLDEFSKAFPDSFNILLLDNASAHTTKGLRIPENVGLLFQPVSCPELNPAERVWQELRAKLAWQQFGHIEALEDELMAHLEQYQPATLQSLTAYPYLLHAYYAACVSLGPILDQIPICGNLHQQGKGVQDGPAAIREIGAKAGSVSGAHKPDGRRVQRTG